MGLKLTTSPEICCRTTLHRQCTVTVSKLALACDGANLEDGKTREKPAALVHDLQNMDTHNQCIDVRKITRGVHNNQRLESDARTRR